MAERRFQAEAKNRWPESTDDDFVSVMVLSGKAMEVGNAILERRVDNQSLH
jgi:hypothetical protein